MPDRDAAVISDFVPIQLQMMHILCTTYNELCIFLFLMYHSTEEVNV
jgi:hypothetical protein